MRREVLKNNRKSVYAESLFGETVQKRRGAEVFGFSQCPEVHSFMEDVSPESDMQRMLSMMFAGNFSAFPALPFFAGFSEVDIEDF